MKPDKETVERWMSGKLSGEELESVEVWASECPEELETAMNWGETAQLVRDTIPASEEPPYGDFLNHKIQQQVELESQGSVIRSSPTSENNSIWNRMRYLWAPLGVAAMVTCFYAGTLMKPSSDIVGSEIKGQLENRVGEIYVPQGGVTASVYENDQSGVIMLEGLQAIPDSLDIVSIPASGRPFPERSAEVMVKLEMPEYF